MTNAPEIALAAVSFAVPDKLAEQLLWLRASILTVAVAWFNGVVTFDPSVAFPSAVTVVVVAPN